MSSNKEFNFNKQFHDGLMTKQLIDHPEIKVLKKVETSMTTTIEEGNKIIAAFFGLKYGWWTPQEKPLTDDKKQWCDMDAKTFLGSYIYYNKDLKFHSSWDWIHPVYRKVTEIGLWMVTNRHDRLWIEKSKEIEYTMLNEETPEKASVKIAQLIQWYNNQKDSNV